MAAARLDMMVDAVDERDRVVGQLPRREVFARRANFRVAHVLLTNEEGRLLLQQLGPDHPRHPGLWGSSAAGYLSAGEGYLDAACRKVSEELGVRAPPLEEVGKSTMPDAGVTKFVGVWAGHHEGPFRVDGRHVARVQFTPVREVTARLRAEPASFTPTFHHVLPLFRTRLGEP